MEQLVDAFNRSVYGLIDREDQVKRNFKDIWGLARLMVQRDSAARPAIMNCRDLLQDLTDDRRRLVPPGSPTELATPSDDGDETGE